MKKGLLICLSLCLAINLFAEEQISKIRVGVLTGPSCIPAAYLMDNPKAENYELSFETFATPQNLLPKLLKKEVDIGFMPLNVAAKVYNSANKAIICAAVTGNGNLTLITKNKNVKRIKDLYGERVYIAGQGATPEYIFRYILVQNDMENEVSLDYSIPTANLAASLIADKIEYAVVPEPFATIATTKDKEIFYAIDLQKEYSVLSQSETYPLTCLVVREEFAKKNPEAVKAFLNSYEISSDWTNKNPAKAGSLCEKYNLGLAAGIVKNAVPKSNYVYQSAAEAKIQIEQMLSIFMSFDKSSVGEKLPDSDFYLE